MIQFVRQVDAVAINSFVSIVTSQYVCRSVDQPLALPLISARHINGAIHAIIALPKILRDIAIRLKHLPIEKLIAGSALPQAPPLLTGQLFILLHSAV